MKIKKLQFENFRTFLHNEITFPDYPIVVIYDENGKGKTSIQEGVLWGLAGEIYRYNRSDLKSEYGTRDALHSLRSNKKSRIQLILEMEDDQGKSLITKINRPERNKTYLTASQDPDQQYSINNNPVDENEFKDIIEDILEIQPRQFQTTNFLSQEIINEALVTDENIRANVFSQLLSFDWMQDINGSISDEIKELRSIKRSFEHQKDKLMEKLQETEINKLWEDVQTHAKQLEEKHELILNNKGKITVQDYLLRILEVCNLLQLTDTAEEINGYLSDQNQMQELTFEKIKQYHNLLDQEIKGLREQIGGMTSELKISEKEADTIAKKITEYKKGEIKINELNTEISKKRKARDTIDTERNKMKTDVSNLEDSFSNIQKLRKSHTTHTNDLETIKSEEGTKKEIDKKINDLNESEKQIIKDKEHVDDNILKITEAKEEIKNIRSTITNISDELNKLDTHSKDKFRKQFNDILSSTGKILNNLKETDREKLQAEHQKLVELSVADFNPTAIKEHLQSLIDVIKSIPIQSHLADLEKTQSNYNLHEAAMQRLPQLEELKTSITNDIEKIENDQASLNSELQNFNEITENDDTSIGSFRLPTMVFSTILTIGSLVATLLFPSPGRFVFFSFSIIGGILLFLILRPDIWLNKEHHRSSMAKFVTKQKFKELFESDKRQIKGNIDRMENNLRDLKKELIDIEEKINGINIQKDELSLHSRETLQSAFTAYKELLKQHELYSNMKNDLSELISKDQKEIQIEKERKLLQEMLDELINSLTKVGKQEIDYNGELTEILGKSKSKTIQLETELSEIGKKRKLLEQAKETFAKLEQSINEIALTLKENFNIDIAKIEDKYQELDDEIKKQKENLKQKNQEFENIKSEIKTLTDSLTSHNTHFISTKEYLIKQISILGFNSNLLEKEEEAITTKINDSITKNKNKQKKSEEIIQKAEKISQEISLLDDYFAKLQLLQSRWNDKQQEIKQHEAKIEILNKKIENTIELEKSWKLVSDQLQETTGHISDQILQVIKDDVIDNFEILGGHTTLPYVDLEIRMLRNKLNVSIHVGTDKKNVGSPKILFSNGQQVSLILAIFFAMGRQILKKSKLKWIGLDEPTQYLDSNRKADFVDFIHVFYENNPEVQLIITTADREFLEMLEHKSDDIFHITDVDSISSSKFSKPSSSHIPIGSNGTSKTNTSKVQKVELDLDEPLTIPDIDDMVRTPVSSIGLIDEGPQVREYKCSICQIMFKSVTYQNTCNKSECISEYRKTIFG